MEKSKKPYRNLSRIMMIVSGMLVLLAVMIAAAKPESGSALSGDLSSAVAKYPILSGSMLQTCDLCHTASIPNLNPYGAAYKANGRSPSAFTAIENLDSDGDGFKNIQEINALTFPGNASSFPSVPAPTNTPVPTLPNPTNTPVATFPNPANTATPTVVVGPSATPILPPNTVYAAVGLAPASVLVGGSSIATVSLNNIPAGGFASAEFTCMFNPAIIKAGSIAVTNLFGGDPVTAINGPQNGSFIVAIAGSNGNKALSGGAAFTFSAEGLQAGQSSMDCQARVSTGNLVLASIPSTPASLVVTTTTTTQGTFSGQVLAGKPVTLTLYDAGNAVAGSMLANGDGAFSFQGAAGSYSAVASAPGYLRARGAIIITSGNTISLPAITLPAGDIDGNDVIDQFDALTIGINYNGSAPAAADLNNDGIINVLDLEVLARNYRKTGPLVWQ